MVQKWQILGNSLLKVKNAEMQRRNGAGNIRKYFASLRFLLQKKCDPHLNHAHFSPPDKGGGEHLRNFIKK